MLSWFFFWGRTEITLGSGRNVLSLIMSLKMAVLSLHQRCLAASSLPKMNPGCCSPSKWLLATHSLHQEQPALGEPVHMWAGRFLWGSPLLPLPSPTIVPCFCRQREVLSFFYLFYFPTVQQGVQVILRCIHCNYSFPPHFLLLQHEYLDIVLNATRQDLFVNLF